MKGVISIRNTYGFGFSFNIRFGFAWLAIVFPGILLNANPWHAREQPAIEVSVSPARAVNVAEPFQFTIRVMAPHGCQVTFPEVPLKVSEFDVLSCNDQFDIPSGDGTIRTWTRNLELEGVRAGTWTIAPVRVEVQTLESPAEKQILQPEPISVEIVSTLPDEVDATKFKPVTDLEDMPGESTSSNWWFIWAIAGSVLACAALVFVFRVRSRSASMGSDLWLRKRLQRLQGLNQHPDERETWEEEFCEEFTLITGEYLATQCGVPRELQSSDYVHQFLLEHDLATG